MNRKPFFCWTPITGLQAKKPYWIWLVDKEWRCVLAEPWRIETANGVTELPTGCIWIDRLFRVHDGIWLADWRTQRLFFFSDQRQKVEEIIWPEAPEPAAFFTRDTQEHMLLHRSACQILRLGADGQIKQRLGSRLGIDIPNRLGFELPQDAVFDPVLNQALVADTGNQRLVRVSLKDGEFVSLPLPIYPQFILHDGPKGWLISDGATDLVWGNDQIGAMVHVCQQPAVFSRLYRQDGRTFTADETGDWGELHIDSPPQAFSLEDTDLLPQAQQTLTLRAGDFASLTNDPTLTITSLLGHLKTPDFGHKLGRYLNTQADLFRFLPDPWALLPELDNLASEMVRLVKAIPLDGEPEPLRIDKAHIAYRLKLMLAHMAKSLREWRLLSIELSQIAGQGEADALLAQNLGQRASEMIKTVLAHYRQAILPLDEQAFIGHTVRYILARKVLSELLLDRHGPFLKPLNRDLVSALENHHVVLAELYLDCGQTDLFKEHYRMAIRSQPSQHSLPLKYIDKLFEIGDIGEIERQIKALPNQRQQDLNARLSRLYALKGDRPRAAEAMRKELDLFPHRLELIMQLLALDVLSEEEFQQRIKKALVARHGQIDTLYHLGRIYLSRNDLPKAMDALLSEGENYPENEAALLMIKEILFTRPQFKRKFSAQQAARLWRVLSAYLRVRQVEKTFPDGLQSLLFVLNHLDPGVVSDQEFISFADASSNPEWSNEVQAFIKWRQIKGTAFAWMSFHTQDLPQLLESFSCREALSKELLTSSECTDDICRQIALLYPEGMPEDFVPRPMHLHLSQGRLYLRERFLFEKAHICSHELFFSKKSEPGIFRSDLQTQDQGRKLISISGTSNPHWSLHPEKKAILLWDESTQTLIECDLMGVHTAQVAIEGSPRLVCPYLQGWMVCFEQKETLYWAILESEENSLSISFIKPPPDNVFPMLQPGPLGLFWSADGRIWNYRDGAWLAINKARESRYLYTQMTFWPEKNVFVGFERSPGVPCCYLSLLDRQGVHLQRIFVHWGGIDWLAGSDSEHIFLGARGKWLAAFAFSWQGA